MVEIGHSIEVFDELDSTNNYVAKAIDEGHYREGTVILSHFQTQGRGQRGNEWQSNRGENLTFSFAINTAYLASHKKFLLSKAISVAMTDALKALLGLDASVKWPNDLLASDSKIAGILIENKGYSTDYSIVGIGLNVNQIDFSTGHKASSIRKELGAGVSVNTVLYKILESLNQRLGALEAGFDTLIHSDYMAALYGSGQWVKIQGNTEAFQAMIVAVDDEGVIYLRHKSGRLSQHRAKEIKISF